MKQVTLKALKGSIAKWTSIAAGKGVDLGDDNCPLCHEFIDLEPACTGCPVKKATKRSFCVNTPYDEWTEGLRAARLGDADSGNRRASTPALAAIARKELRFLKSLLPKKSA